MADQTNTKFCGECGTEMAPAAKFCHSCGTEFGQFEVTPRSTPSRPDSSCSTHTSPSHQTIPPPKPLDPPPSKPSKHDEHFPEPVVVDVAALQQAIQEYDELLSADHPDSRNALTYWNRGLAYATLGQPQRAIPDFDMALRLDPDLNAAYTGKADVELERYQQDLQNFDEVLRRNPVLSEAYSHRAVSKSSSTAPRAPVAEPPVSGAQPNAPGEPTVQTPPSSSGTNSDPGSPSWRYALVTGLVLATVLTVYQMIQQMAVKGSIGIAEIPGTLAGFVVNLVIWFLVAWGVIAAIRKLKKEDLMRYVLTLLAGLVVAPVLLFLMRYVIVLVLVASLLAGCGSAGDVAACLAAGGTWNASNRTCASTQTATLTAPSTSEATTTPKPEPTATPTPEPTATPTPEPTTTPTPVSPAGRTQIAFSSLRDGALNIFVMDPDGGNVRQLTDSPGGHDHPAWSPDGSQIAFVSDRDGSIYVMDADGGNVRRLTDAPGINSEPAWSPFGGQIAFVSDRDGSKSIYVMDTDGGHVRRLTDAPFGDDTAPTWSPDGSQIAFQSERDGGYGIYVMDTGGRTESNVRRLTYGPGWYEAPAWSPDGSQIAFERIRVDGDIYIMDADGGNVRRRTDNPGWDTAPAWSPDGTQIAFQSVRGGAARDIYVMDADGRNVRRLTDAPLQDMNPAWSPVLQPRT